MLTSPPRPILLRSALLEAGYTDHEIQAATSSGRWAALHPGIYCAGGDLANLAELERHVLRARGLAERAPDTVLSHVSAAAIIGMPLYGMPLDRVHLTRPGRGGNQQSRSRTLHSGRLAPDDIALAAGVRVTRPARTIVDVARTARLDSAVVAADAALHKEWVTGAEIEAALASAGHVGGIGRARRAMALADGRCESPGETRLRLALVLGGLPAPDLQITVVDGTGHSVGRCDLGYPERGVLLEFDGREKYLKLLREGQEPHDAVVAEKIREDRIRELGYLVVRLVWSDLSNPSVVVRRVREAVHRAGAIVAAGGPAGSWNVSPPLGVSSAR